MNSLIRMQKQLPTKRTCRILHTQPHITQHTGHTQQHTQQHPHTSRIHSLQGRQRRRDIVDASVPQTLPVTVPLSTSPSPSPVIRRVGRPPSLSIISPSPPVVSLSLSTASSVDISDVTVVRDSVSAARVLSILQSPSVRARYHAIDTEVTDIDIKNESPVGKGRITCFTVFAGEDVDFGHGHRLFIDTLDPIDGCDMFSLFKCYLEDRSIKKVFHNYSFDAHVLMNHGIQIKGFSADTMHMARLCDSSRTHYSLESLTSDYLQRGKISMKHRFSLHKVKRDGTESKLTELPHIQDIQRSEQHKDAWVDYATYDAQSTWMLREVLERELRNQVNPALVSGAIDSLLLPHSPSHSHSPLLPSPITATGLDVSGSSMFAFYNLYWVPFGQMLVDMERQGIYIRAHYLPLLEQQAIQDQQRAKDKFLSWAVKYDPSAQYMNINSLAQKKQFFFGARDSRVLFDRENTEGVVEEGKNKPKKKVAFALRGLGLEPISFTKNKQEAVSLPVLNALSGRPPSNPPHYGHAYQHFSRFSPTSTHKDGADACEAIHALCAISGINMMINTFIQPLQSQCDDYNRIHCSLNLNTETGRLSARKPNLQNQPALDKDIYKVRDAFAAEPGNSLIVADYGQLELRLLAHMTNCSSMIEAFRAGGDFHSRTAMSMYPHIADKVAKGEVLLEAGDRVSPDDSRPLLKHLFAVERKKAKTLNFSIAYGKTARGLAKDWNTSVTEAEQTLQRWYADRPEVQQWQQQTIAAAHTTELTRTLLGRTRPLPGINGADKALRAHLERAAINTPIQGGAADVMMMSMLRLHHHDRWRELGWKVILQIHDEIICEGPQQHVTEAMQIVRSCMENPFTQLLLVELVVDAKSDVTWYKAK